MTEREFKRLDKHTNINKLRLTTMGTQDQKKAYGYGCFNKKPLLQLKSEKINRLTKYIYQH
jgi:hypothetical protein